MMSDRLEKINDMINESHKRGTMLAKDIMRPETDDDTRRYMRFKLKNEIEYRMNLKSQRNRIIKEQVREDQHELL